MLLAKPILMFIKDIITIEEAYYLVIHYLLKNVRKSWETADGFVVLKFSRIRNFR